MTWKQRILGLGATGGFELPSSKTDVEGIFETRWTLQYVGQQVQITKASAQIEHFTIHAGKQRIEEPKINHKAL
jgi:hypothetical protein